MKSIVPISGGLNFICVPKWRESAVNFVALKFFRCFSLVQAVAEREVRREREELKSYRCKKKMTPLKNYRCKKRCYVAEVDYRLRKCCLQVAAPCANYANCFRHLKSRLCQAL